jgi:RNase P subunit RPR2
MAAKRADTCADCKKSIAVGDAIVWCPSTRYTFCGECGRPLLNGANAERSYERYGNDLYYER